MIVYENHFSIWQKLPAPIISWYIIISVKLLTFYLPEKINGHIKVINTHKWQI